MSKDEVIGALPPSEKEVLKWAIENSQDVKNIRNDHLMSHEEFKEMWNDLCPDTVQQLKDNIAKIQSNPPRDEMYLALDRLLFIVEDIDAADWFVDLHGFDIVLPLLENEDAEVRMAAAWIIANILQNNPKDQQKFTEQVGMERVMKPFQDETVEKPMARKFSLISNAIRGSKILRQQFYQLGGIKAMMDICTKFKQIYFKFCWLIGAILDENDEDDKKVFDECHLKEYLIEHKADINDDEVLENVISRM
ncbi:hsp70 nucleotide exchange factor FES1 [Histomonas meleagridis]|uniref:hsp70 nucleotide exchange factor FES1 n=1 Tax=Histomonas meleagridis TaxID=135588 RepID=UPI003559B30E|nr:hsp70 nucleotide exchange factor FES1 [Histomonas meleagridis]KAH0802557.1 hsp70 nucleotide exchange factor FES1 [Histomonas meleagridis]